jgi:hypothetical protein
VTLRNPESGQGFESRRVQRSLLRRIAVNR